MGSSILSDEEKDEFKGKVKSFKKLRKASKEKCLSIDPILNRIAVLLKNIIANGSNEPTAAGKDQVNEYIKELANLENAAICAIHQIDSE